MCLMVYDVSLPCHLTSEVRIGRTSDDLADIDQRLATIHVYDERQPEHLLNSTGL